MTKNHKNLISGYVLRRPVDEVAQFYNISTDKYQLQLTQ